MQILLVLKYVFNLHITFIDKNYLYLVDQRNVAFKNEFLKISVLP